VAGSCAEGSSECAQRREDAASGGRWKQREAQRFAEASAARVARQKVRKAAVPLYAVSSSCRAAACADARMPRPAPVYGVAAQHGPTTIAMAFFPSQKERDIAIALARQVGNSRRGGRYAV